MVAHIAEYTTGFSLCRENAGPFFDVLPHLEHLSPAVIFIGFGDTLSATRNIGHTFSCLLRSILCLKDYHLDYMGMRLTMDSPGKYQQKL